MESKFLDFLFSSIMFIVAYCREFTLVSSSLPAAVFPDFLSQALEFSSTIRTVNDVYNYDWNTESFRGLDDPRQN